MLLLQKKWSESFWHDCETSNSTLRDENNSNTVGIMKISVSILVIIFLIVQAGYSQNFAEGQILDAESEEPIPYVNIGITRLMTGTVSHENGAFRLEYNSEDDLITFSAIGYEIHEMAVRDLLSNGSVYMSPTTYEMDEIIVQEKALGKIKNLGYKLDKRGESVGFGSTQLGTEIGALIEIDRETIIYQAFFTVNRTTDEELLFRVNLYEFENGESTRNLIPENVLVAAPEKSGTFSVNLTKYNIVTEKDVMLSLEWVKAVSLEQDEIQDIAFRADKTRRNPNAYLRSTSLAPMVSMEQFVKYNLGFYLTARQVRQ